MSLEQEIRQTAFRNEHQKAILNILHTQNFLVGRMTEVFKAFGLTRQQYNVLRILRGQYPEPASINLIKERMLEKMSDTSRIVERLRVKGLVHREDAKADKRSVEVTITSEGLELLSRMKESVENFEGILNNLSQQEAGVLNLLLDKVRFRARGEKQETEGAMELLSQPEKF